MDTTDWTKVTELFNGFIDEGNPLQVRVYSPDYDEALEVTIPHNKVRYFMERLPLFDAVTTTGSHKKIEDDG